MIKKQEKMIKDTDWDILIIVDACRYDYFKMTYPEYLDGNLEKVISPASHTTEWRRKIFSRRADFKDVVYISANPYINSKIDVAGFNARDKFHEIVDLWNFGWDDDLGTVPPNRISNELERKLKETNSRRIIAHYMQPHAPYLGINIGKFGGSVPSQKKWSPDWAIGRFLSWIERKVFLPLTFLKFIYLFRLFIGLGVGAERETFARRGRRGLRKGYERNLRLVLASISKLASQDIFKNKKTIITADHGELLGDNLSRSCLNKNRFSHPPNSKNPKLIEVPWFHIYPKAG